MSAQLGTKLQAGAELSHFEKLPRHIAIIMDGNGRWAKKRFLPRSAGHDKGVENVYRVVRECVRYQIPYLTLFAFSSENWDRPAGEVSFLMKLLKTNLEKEIQRLNEEGIRLVFVGNVFLLSSDLQILLKKAEDITKENTKLILNIAISYGGKWDIIQAVNKMTSQHPERIGEYDEALFSSYLSLSNCPDPDLFIRTGGEKRVSNFLLWQMAYSELFFSHVNWPDFDEAAFCESLAFYSSRERRLGKTSEQISS